MGIGTFGAFTQARLAIYTAQTGISVTGNNISNINTPGYTRQRLNQTSLSVAGSDRWYAVGDVRSGQGVLARSISQIRNPYLDIRYREESAKVGYQNAKLDGLNSIARILDEVGKGVDDEKGFGVIALEISKLISALQDLSTETGHQEYDNIVRQVASNLVNRLNGYAARLEEVRQNTIDSYDKNVDRINDILNSIRTYNEEIRICDIHGDPALELRDERNLLLDELSGLIDIEVTYEEEVISAGISVEKLVVRLGNANTDPSVNTDESLLVDGIYTAQLSKGKPMENPYYNTNLNDLTPDERQALIDELKGRAGLVSYNNDEEMLQAYTSAQYLYQKKDENGNVVEEQPVTDIRDATILTGEDNDNYDIMITELRNKLGELYKETIVGKQRSVDPTSYEVRTDTGTVELLRDLFASEPNDILSITKEVKDYPQKGDTYTTICKRTPVRDADGNITGWNYTVQEVKQIVSKPVALDDNDLGGELQGNRELLTEKGEFIDASVITDVDENALSKRGIQYYQRSLDLLANQLAKIMNEANQGFYRFPDGSFVSTEKGVDENGKEINLPFTIEYNPDWPDTTSTRRETVTLNAADITAGWDDEHMNRGYRHELLMATGIHGATDGTCNMPDGFTPEMVITAYLKGQKFVEIPGSDPTEFEKDEAGNYVLVDLEKDDPYYHETGIFVGGNLFSNGGNTDDDTNITASNISISKTWQTKHILVQDFVCPYGESKPASGASDNIIHMKYLLDTQKWDFNANTLASTSNALDGPMFNGTLFEYWNNVGFVLGKDQDYANTELTVAYETGLAIDTDRSSVSSVDFNDEAMNLMMYSKSYNAACRLMTTIDSMIDKLVNGTGMTT